MHSFFGHEKRWSQIMMLLQNDQLAHALLFYGTEGIGKKQLALELAETILCQDEASRKQLRGGTFPDFLLVDEEGIIKVETVAVIQRFLSEKPIYGRKKVVIIDNVDQMNIQGQNKFLKTLEEAPLFCHLILISAKPHQLLETIRSRLIGIHFEPLSDALVFEHLPKTAPEIDRRIATDFAMGSFTKALQILEDPMLKHVFMLPGTIYQSMLDYEYVKLLQNVQSMDKKLIPLLVDHLTLWLRDIAIIREDRDSAQVLYKQSREKLIRQSSRITAEKLPIMMRRLEQCKDQIEANVNAEVSLYAALMEIQEELNR